MIHIIFRNSGGEFTAMTQHKSQAQSNTYYDASCVRKPDQQGMFIFYLLKKHKEIMLQAIVGLWGTQGV